MELVLRRRRSNHLCTIGDLYCNGDFCVYTLEDVVRENPVLPVSEWKLHGATAIPQGRYRITITNSKRFGRPLPLVNMVEGFEGVRIHPGNGPDDTDGCVLPGMSVSPEETRVLESRFAFNKLYLLIDDALAQGDDVWLDVRNA